MTKVTSDNDDLKRGVKRSPVPKEKSTPKKQHTTPKARTRWDDGAKAMENMFWGKETNRGYKHNPEHVIPDLFIAEAAWLPYLMEDETIVHRRGLFTSKSIKKGQIITTYAGPGKYVHRDKVGTEEAAYYMTLMRGSTQGSVYVIDGIREPQEGCGYGSFANDRRNLGPNNSKQVPISALGLICPYDGHPCWSRDNVLIRK